MSINAETIGDALMIQHYVAEVHEPHLCRTLSVSDAITLAGRNKVEVVWELSVKKLEDRASEYTNHIHATATDEFMALLKQRGIPFEKCQGRKAAASDAHDREETLNFAKSIERRATQRASAGAKASGR